VSVILSALIVETPNENGLIPPDQPAGHLVVVVRAFCPQIVPFGPFLSVIPIRKYCTVHSLPDELFHGLEDVTNSIAVGPKTETTATLKLVLFRSEATEHSK
jgi:hypothetical protein